MNPLGTVLVAVASILVVLLGLSLHSRIRFAAARRPSGAGSAAVRGGAGGDGRGGGAAAPGRPG